MTVFESADVALFLMAKATLDGAGIRYVADGEGLQDLFGVGRLFAQYNFITGPPRLRVLAEDSDRARELLAELTG